MTVSSSEQEAARSFPLSKSIFVLEFSFLARLRKNKDEVRPWATDCEH